jgi:serine protease Do
MKLMQKLESPRLRAYLGAGALALAGVTAVVLVPSMPVAAQGTAASASAATAAPPLVRGLPDFTELVEQVGPSVVNIRTMAKVRMDAEGDANDEMQELFRRFFGVPTPNLPHQGPKQRPKQPQQEEVQPTGVGSGFILSADGLILTNAHVVDGADEVIVTLTDKREFKAKLIGTDKRSDVAVVKIEANALPAVKLGDVGRLKVGEWVMAIGSPFGLENSVTAGIVSAKQRDTGDYLPFIQTDVAINPGNSGGPLINMRGEVVGINSQIYSRSGGYMGIAFAIPIDEVVRVSDQLRAHGHVTRGRIGVQIDQVSKDVAESIGLGKPQGALVRAVEKGSPADKAGVEAGDIITRFDGKAIEKASDLPRLVGSTKPGTRSTLTVFRRGNAKDLTLLIGEVEADKTTASKPDEDDEASSTTSQVAKWLGLSVSELSPAQKKELQVRGGVKVEAVSEAAARAGLRPDDVIMQIGNTEVSNVKSFEAAVTRLDKTKPVNMLVRRGAWVQYVLIRPSR